MALMPLSRQSKLTFCISDFTLRWQRINPWAKNDVEIMEHDKSNQSINRVHGLQCGAI